MPEVLERIRSDGPLCSRDFAPPADRKRQTWWGWRPIKVALEMLFWRGELMIAERRNYTRVYDLTERVLPGAVETRMPDAAEVGRFFVRRALKAYGIATKPEITEHIRGADNGIIEAALADMAADGEVTPVTIAGDDAACFALPEMLEIASRLRKTARRLHILSPFDNLIIQRKRTARLFDFDYTLECYVPGPKRVHGYFVLPILWGERFIGRLDAKADRGKKILIVKNLLLENTPSDADACLAALAEKLHAMAARNGCERVALERCRPARYKKEVARLLS